ncbi:amino acid ABC transporter permease [Sediminispirochaeta smaragdinae]|uniref:Polar amino acid ABC transporter, inner membrane subunit n=1 Tax=Sediminispirochaeta smaragdinae (strain DSM 11293 / JCM 15392 / SEBR 4228) TaxID=573413 RepID=E1RC52_SEDSS|nr:amino acid ABC transporter permease [Sediminispirochaeta smaragdinae]ADK79932.1 polar amino acid ABC transporter, inner membrane subunit [Sediminispirochaeta smaragdinae DSM 11293]
MNDFLSTSLQILKPLLLHGFPNTFLLSVVPLFFSLILGIIGGVLGNSKISVLRVIAKIYVYLFRNIPFLIFVYVAYYGFPYLGVNIPPLTTAVVALAINHGSYMTEIMRGGLNTIRREQIEASASIGLNIFQQYSLVIIPQTIMEVAPSIVGQTILLVKDTSIISVIGISELTRIGRQITMLTNSPFLVFFYVAVFYYVLCFLFQMLSNWSEAKVKKYIG